MKAYLRTLSILQTAFIMGLTIFVFIAGFLVKTGSINRGRGPVIPDMPDYFLYVALGLVAAIILASAAVFKKQVGGAAELRSINDKLAAYRNAFIRRIFIPEMAAILSIIITILTENLKYLSLAGLVILTFIAWFPTAEKLLNGLGVTESELDETTSNPS